MNETKIAFLRAFVADMVNAIADEKENAAGLQRRILELEAKVKELTPAEPVPVEAM